MTSHLDPYTFVLDADHNVVQHDNDDEWWLWYLDMSNRRVGYTEIAGGQMSVSTVFTAMDITPDRGRMFETKVFGGDHDQETFRCATWDEAVRQHHEVVTMVSNA